MRNAGAVRAVQDMSRGSSLDTRFREALGSLEAGLLFVECTEFRVHGTWVDGGFPLWVRMGVRARQVPAQRA
jgi:hypothetical protein